MAKALAVQKPKGKALGKVGDYRQEMAKYAKEDSARLPSGAGNYISIRGKNFTYQGAALDDPLKVVVIDYGFENALYEGKWDPENPSPPVCFAMSKTNDDLSPHEDSPKPQSDHCKECPHNQFGTADTGKGKACKNSLRLALLSTSTKKFDAEFVGKTDTALIKLPPTSMKHFRGYLKKITEGLQLPLFSVITALSFDEEEATPVVIPQFEDEINERKTLTALIGKRDTVQAALLQPFDVSGYSEEKPKKKKAKPEKAKPKITVRKSKF
jgi:hypothetical protein